MKRPLVIGGVVLGLLLLGGGLILGAVAYHHNPSSCGLCHIMEPHVASWRTPGTLAFRHAEAGVACLDCHQEPIEASVQKVVDYVKGDYEDPIFPRRFSNAFCFDCHSPGQEHASYEQVAARTADLAAKGLTRNPHDSHWGEVDCATCHSMHQEASLDYCSTCHLDATATNPRTNWKVGP
ncbi:cytochrome c3 family protein [Symbiobacterium terraclitae]|uniref:cytochrome c3 family protein n=1 Tax=Symbiobacterium terraclitae TaxID=557451 RepID=UPI0035B5310D